VSTSRTRCAEARLCERFVHAFRVQRATAGRTDELVGVLIRSLVEQTRRKLIDRDTLTPSAPLEPTERRFLDVQPESAHVTRLLGSLRQGAEYGYVGLDNSVGAVAVTPKMAPKDRPKRRTPGPARFRERRDQAFRGRGERI
jgi:hypothetical protein